MDNKCRGIAVILLLILIAGAFISGMVVTQQVREKTKQECNDE